MDYAQRRRTRQMKAVMAGMKIEERLGKMDTRQAVQEVRIAALAAVAETRALWLFLEERGLATAAQREDYLDKGYDALLAQVESAASRIYVDTPNA